MSLQQRLNKALTDLVKPSDPEYPAIQSLVSQLKNTALNKRQVKQIVLFLMHDYPQLFRHPEDKKLKALCAECLEANPATLSGQKTVNTFLFSTVAEHPEYFSIPKGLDLEKLRRDYPTEIQSPKPKSSRRS